MDPIQFKQDLLTYLDEVLNFESAKLVGKVFKRCEIINERECLKQELRELIYEQFRDIKDIFVSYGKGLEKTYFILKSKENKNE